MRAVHFQKSRLSLETDRVIPDPPPGEALIRVAMAGICNTDLEIVNGYFGFEGVLGHEFVGVVESVNSEDADDKSWIGKRVVGEINDACFECETCRRGDPTHCPHRTTLGIFKRNGAMADYVSLPVALLHAIPNNLPNDRAVFVEPLAAACEITERLAIRPTDRVVVLGDGKLGLLCAQVLRLTGCSLIAVGRHRSKLDILKRQGVETRLLPRDAEADKFDATLGDLLGAADIVVEATGAAEGFATARRLVRPRGTIVLKSTYHGDLSLNMSMIVVDEVTLIGSRCGPFAPALRLLQNGLIDTASLLSETHPLDDALHAFERAAKPGFLKVLLRVE